MNKSALKKLKTLLKDIRPYRIYGRDVKWKKAWGTAGVMEKRLVAKDSGLPFSLTLKRFPKRNALLSKRGYKVHSHPTLEIGYVLKGKVKIYFEDVGLKEFKEGDVVVQPPGLKHAAVSTDKETIILAFNIPPADWEE